jgi:hypothetical protein
LNGVLTTFNEGGLCRQALRYWISNGWVVVAPYSPLVAIAGPAFTRDLTLQRFCGQVEAQARDSAAELETEPPAAAQPEGGEEKAE